ncbi:MAG TPA: Hsp20/alpha crystallin family protein [Acidimicrobiales bacterium]|nr:Hsp20/alpha crystallin family protein [Acidimicrobiales bacterium]
MRTDPFRDLDRLAEQLAGTRTRPAAMPLDAYRDGERFVVHFDLPGVSADSIELTVERNVLSVHATRARAQSEHVDLLMNERPHGTFTRQLFLGESLDTDAIEASYEDGVLTLQIPVAERAKPRRVQINTAGAASPTEISTRGRGSSSERERVGAGTTN